MKGCGKLNVVLSWDDGNYCCQFKRGHDREDWNDLSRDEQVHAVGAMVSMAELFEKFIKDSD